MLIKFFQIFRFPIERQFNFFFEETLIIHLVGSEPSSHLVKQAGAAQKHAHTEPTVN